MQPELIITPFGESADPATVRDIPQSNPSGAPRQNASWEQGFPLITMTPIAAGGIPPEGPDMNGVLRAISRHASFVGGGGQYKWSAEYVAAKGGYPKGAVIQSDNGEVSYVSTEDGNSTNFNAYPDSIGKQWVFFGGATSYFELQFEQEQEKRENEFNQFLINTAFEMPPIPFVEGSILEISRPTQLISHEGQLYSVRMPASFPVILSDIWDVAVASLTPRSDEALRQQLADSAGASITGWDRLSPESTSHKVSTALDAIDFSPWEFSSLVTSRPNQNSPETWDWTPAFKALHSAVMSAKGVKCVNLQGSFNLEGGLDPTQYEWSNLSFRCSNASLTVNNPTGDNLGLQIGSNVSFIGHFTSRITNGTGNANGFVRLPICIGRWWDSAEVSNVYAESLDVTGMSDGVAISIAGNTHGVIIDRLKLGGGQLGLMMHWSGLPENINPTTTYHPHDIHIGTVIGSGYTETMVTESACYDIHIGSIRGSDNYRDFNHIGGDFGDSRAISRDKGKVCRGNSIGFMNAELSRYRAFDFNASAGKTAWIMAGEIFVDSLTATGVGGAASDGTVGVRLENLASGGIKNANVSGFESNIVSLNSTGGRHGVLRSSNSRRSGVIFNNTQQASVDSVYTTGDNTLAGGGVGGLSITSTCKDLSVDNLYVKTANAATNGASIASGAADIRILKASGAVDSTRFLVVDGGAANVNRVGPCVLDSGAISYSGPDPTVSLTARGHSMGWGAAAPTTGSSKRGDFIMTTNASPGGKAGLICTTSGANGSTAVFKPWGTIDS